MEQVKLEWKGGMQFDAQVGEHTITLDGPEELGGMNIGARPKPLLLVALAGCTGMDIASLARKMRVEFERIEIEADAEKSDEIPVVYTAMTLKYRFEGKGIDPSKPLKWSASRRSGIAGWPICCGKSRRSRSRYILTANGSTDKRIKCSIRRWPERRYSSLPGCAPCLRGYGSRRHKR